ncbi:MAG TPA: hypothetical protein ENJ82_02080, partial [Bacteroidetes bacterium]|nr:hypothetical protein [Bacteroidota bacterium]
MICIAAKSGVYANHPKEKSISAVRLHAALKLDGMLNDAAWQEAPIATDFVQSQPINGGAPSQRTEVRILYDNKAIYIGAMLFDTAPDSILSQLSKRDVGGGVNTDYFSVAFDTYDDDQNAFHFAVSAAGVQTDSRLSQVGEDDVWDAVWKSEVRITDDGWSVEMEIPYSALRFPKRDVQRWGMQIRRIIRRRRETVYWNFVDRSIDGIINQFGTLDGLRGIEPPIRLALTPYVSGYVQRFSPGAGPGIASNSYSFNAGADLKLGLSESFTLDMTLVPDFGQVVSDNQVLNLSPFEVRFQENRQFFTEGTELFNIAGIFYSRRIGGRPRNFGAANAGLRAGESVAQNPASTRLLNAFKISGRTPGRTGLGLFNAMTGPSKALITGGEGGDREVVTQAFTNYNVLVADQSLGGNSYASIINTNRMEADGFMANVTAGRIKLADAGNVYAIQASAASSQRWDKVNQGKPILGYKYNYFLGKFSGNLRFDIGQNVESATYNPNDLGFLIAPNEFTDFGRIAYNVYKPKWKFLAFGNEVGARMQHLEDPRRFSFFRFFYNSWFQLKSFDFFGFRANYRPVDGNDFFESRVTGRSMAIPKGYGVGGFFSSNYARRFALDLHWNFDWRPTWEQESYGYSISPRFRVNDKLQFIFD